LINFLFSDVMSQLSYLLIKIDLDGDISELDTSKEYINNNIKSSLKTVFGELGAGIPFSVLKYFPDTRSIVLECPDSGLVKLRTALTLQNNYQGVDCCYSVSRVTKDLVCLSVN